MRDSSNSNPTLLGRARGAAGKDGRLPRSPPRVRNRNRSRARPVSTPLPAATSVGLAGVIVASCLDILGFRSYAISRMSRQTTQARMPVPLALRFARRDDFSPAWGRRSVFVVCLAPGRNQRKRRSAPLVLRRSRAVPLHPRISARGKDPQADRRRADG